MRRLHALLLFAIALPVLIYGQPAPYPLTHLTKDSLPHDLIDGWLWHPGDLANGASPGLNDSAWKRVKSTLFTNADSTNPYYGIMWMRCHLRIDTSLAAQPIGLRITQPGASRIFLDGRPVATYGIPGDETHTRDFDPQNLPLIIAMPTAGEHIIAIQYANWHSPAYAKRYQEYSKGPYIEIREANDAVNSSAATSEFYSSVLLIVFAVFGTLAISHLLLFLYYRAAASNLWFSIFSALVAIGCLIPHILQTSNSPAVQQAWGYNGWIVTALAACSFSGLINAVFGRKWIRFYIVAGLSAITVGIYFFNTEYAFYGVAALVALVPVEAVLVIIMALVRRRPGITIIGIGMLLFSLMMITVVTTVLITKSFGWTNGTTEGKIMLITIGVIVFGLPLSMSAYLAGSFARLNKKLRGQLGEVRRLSEVTRMHEEEKQRLLETRKEELEHEVAIRTEELRNQMKKSDDLLLNILPAEVAEELKQSGQSAARQYENVTVLFTDFVNFTQHSEGLTPSQLVAEINCCFSAFDNITSKYGLEKIKTVGDAYIAVSGLPAANDNHAKDVVFAALEIRDFMEARRGLKGTAFGIRLGIHSGPVVAGIVGIKKFAYDIWGDTVNTAARMEQHSEGGRLNISDTTYGLVKDSFNCTPRGALEVKHKGTMHMYFVEAPVPPGFVAPVAKAAVAE